MPDLLRHRTGMLNPILEPVPLFFPRKSFVDQDGFPSLRRKREGHHQGRVVPFRNETSQEKWEAQAVQGNAVRVNVYLFRGGDGA